MSKEPKRNVYIGHRYVPKVMGEWEKTETYEGLSIVTHQGTSYTSKKRVPKGIDILNEEYWVVSGNYNAQIEEYRKDVRELEKSVEKDINDLETDVNVNIDEFKKDVNKNVNDFKTDVNVNIDGFKKDVNKNVNDFKTDVTKDIGDLETGVNEKIVTFKDNINEFKTETNEKINENKKELTNSIDYLFKDGNMTLFNIQKRKNDNEQSFNSVQGACFLGGNGNSLEYALAFLPRDGNPDNKAIIQTTTASNNVNENGGSILKLYHANGMDYNPETDSIFVSHANEQTSNGSQRNNDVTELTRDGQTIKRVISPKGIPDNRRVKYYSYDKVTSKKYLGDDKGVYEVDNDLNVLKIIDFSNKFLNYKNWGLGQVATVHNDLIFYLVMGSPTIAVFDLTGKLLTLFEIPKFSSDGRFVGVEPEALFFDNEDNLYLVTRSDYLSFDTSYFFTRIFKMSPFTGQSSDTFIGSHNTRTDNIVYVDSNSSSPISNGSNSYPFLSIDEAVTYALTSESQKGFEVVIKLKKGVYHRSNIKSNGASFKIIGEDGVVLNSIIFTNTNVILENISFENSNQVDSIRLIQSNLTLKGVKINGNNKKYGINVTDGSTIYGINGLSNEITNVNTGIYVNGGIVIGNKASFGVTDLGDNAITTSSSGYAPLM